MTRNKDRSKQKRRAFTDQANALGAKQQHSKERHIYPTIPASWGQDLDGNSAGNQRARLLQAIQERGSITTFECRSELDIMHPAMRKLELVARGVAIDTVRVPELSPCGKIHRVARYILSKVCEVVK